MAVTMSVLLTVILAGVGCVFGQPMDYPLEYRNPSNCNVSDCAVYVGIAVNSSDSNYLDFYIEGDATSWVAVGFSTTFNMPNTDVFACNRISGGDEVEVLDTFNPGYSNTVDSVQDTFMISSSVTDGRISCRFGRSVAGNGDAQDFDLDGDYYVLYGASQQSTSSGSLMPHSTASNPSISTQRVNPVTAQVEATGTMAPGGIPQGVTVPSTAPADYPLVFKTPDSCDVSDCTVYVGIAVNEGNSDYLDFYIEGDAEAWVAVGVSATQNMPNADVMACNRISGGTEVEVLDTWNPDYFNDVDSVQDTFMYTSSVVDGRISCNFGRSIAGTGDTQDLNLNASYFVLFGGSDGLTSSGALVSHRPQSNPSVTEGQVNLVEDSGVAGASGFERIMNGLVRAHGIFMLIAWLLLVQVAVHFAWYMRPALPNGEWFQVHRALMIIALFLSLLGFILIFISQARSSTPGLVDLSDGSRRAHFVIGLVIVVFQIANPIIALFRCHPGDKKRWIFNMIHGYMVGQWSSILSMTNIGLGVAIFSTSYSQWPGSLNIFWVFLAYIVFNILTHVVLILLSCWVGRKHCRKCNCARCGCKCGSDKSGGAVSMSKGDETVAMEDKAKGGDDGEEEEKKKRKEPAEGSIWLWIVMGVNIAVIAIFTFVLLVMVALPQ